MLLDIFFLFCTFNTIASLWIYRELQVEQKQTEIGRSSVIFFLNTHVLIRQMPFFVVI